MDIFKTLILDTPDSLDNISGVLPVVNGGTGADNAPDARVNLLPNYTGNANKVLSLNGTATDVEWTSNGAGDVAGPASSTDNAVARFDSTTGKVIQNSGVTISDANLLTADALSINNNTTLGSSNSDTVTFNARAASEFTPATDNTYDLGRTGHEWRDLYLDGTANIDSLVADTADINGGTIDGTTVGATTPSTGAFTTLTTTGSISVADAANGILFTAGTGRVGGDAINSFLKNASAGGSILMQSSTNATIGAFTNSGLNSTAIGATTPSTGAFTTLSSTGKITSGGNIQVVAAGDLTWGGNYGAGIPVINGTSGVGFTFYPGGSTTGAVAVINASGLAVTGALSASGQATFTKSANSAGSVAALLQNADGNSGIGARLAWRLDNLANEWGYINVNRVGGGATAQMDFAVNNAAYSGAPSVAMTVLGSGNVGIGSTAPARKLTIVGAADQTMTIGNDGPSMTMTNDASNPNAAATTGLLALATSAGQYSLNAGELMMATFGASRGNIVINSNFAGGGASRDAILQPSGGNVGIGTTGPSYQLHLSTDSAAKPSTNTWTIASDARIKTETGEYTKGLDAVLSLRPVTYRYNGKAGMVDDGEDKISIIAQEAINAFPECVGSYMTKLDEDDEEETEVLNWNGHALTFALVNSIKELAARLEALENN